MAQNFETRQNDVVETSNKGWPGDLFRKLWHEIRQSLKVVTWEQRRENKRKEQELKEKQDLRKQRESRETTWWHRDEIESAVHEMKGRISELSRLEWNERSYTYSQLIGPIKTVPDHNKGKKLWLTDRTIEEIWDCARLIKWPSIQLEIFCNYWADQKGYLDKNYKMQCACVIKDPDGDIVLDNMTMWDFRRLGETINIDLDNRIKEAQDKHKRAMERIAGQEIAQNNETIHQQESNQADADLEAQLSNLA